MRLKVLKDEAFSEISSNNQLMTDLATTLGISLLSMPMMLKRKSRRFTELPAISLIAKAMKCKPEDLLTESEPSKTPA